MPTGGKAIGLDYARQLAKNYKQTKLGRTLLANDTQAVWFSKEVLLDALGLPPETSTGSVSGIRIYFGAYETHENYPDNSFDRNKLTIVLIPTGRNSIEIDRGGVTETAMLDIIDDPTMQPSYPGNGTPAPAGKYYNDGQMNPPPVGAAGLGLMDF